MLHTTTCIYITFFFATFLPLIIINQSILATHINSEVEELDITTASKFMIFYFIFPSLFTALELQSGSNRPQANAASGNAVITFLLFFFFTRNTNAKCCLLRGVMGNNGNGYQALGGDV